jgi:hypothetical protein
MFVPDGVIDFTVVNLKDQRALDGAPNLDCECPGW